jgi:hypothetical protein
MRVVTGILFVLSLTAGVALADGPTARARRFTRCCVDLQLPDLPPGPICVQVHARRGISPRLACRLLLGGTPIGKGDCSIAACRTPTT